MSHSKGFFGSCSGNWVNYRKPYEGIQQQKCSKCGQIRQKKVSKCWFFHDYKNKGKPNYGIVKQVCSRCGDKRDGKVRPCLFFHKPGRTRKDPVIRCTRCGAIYEGRSLCESVTITMASVCGSVA